MSTTIHKYRITDCAVQERTTKEIFNYCFGFSDFDFYFEDWFDRLAVDIDSSIKIDFEKFISILSENYKNKGLAFFDLVFRLHKNEFKYLKQPDNPDLVSAEALLWYHIFADLSIDGFIKLPVRELTIEIVQVEDGIITFPQKSEMELWGSQYRAFLIRLLAALPSNNPKRHYPIIKYFERNKQALFEGPLSIDKTNGIIWGLKEENRLQITDNGSWEKYRQLWWYDLMQETIQNSIQNNGNNQIKTLAEYPLEVVRVSVWLHPRWFIDIEDIIKNNAVYDSTAYYVR